jgi:hypothetical protein
VSVLCRWKARGRQEDGSRSDVVCPVLWIADERADMEISTRMTHSGSTATSSLDHLVGAAEQHRRQVEAECLRSLESRTLRLRSPSPIFR